MVAKVQCAAIALLLAPTLLNAGAFNGGTATSPPCKPFVATSTQSSYEECVNYLKREKKKAAVLTADKFVGHKLWPVFLERVAAGDERDLDVAFLLYTLVDGADARDVAVSIASSINNSPALFLQRLREVGFGPERISALVLSTPLSYVDQLEKRIVLFRNRLAAIEGVSEQNLKATQHVVAQILREEIRDLEEILAVTKGRK